MDLSLYVCMDAYTYIGLTSIRIYVYRYIDVYIYTYV